MNTSDQLLKSAAVTFADVAHQHLTFDPRDPTANLILSLIDTKWVQRLRNIRQTGNTNLVYMFAEHSRFGHSLGVAYLSLLLMNKLAEYSPEIIAPYKDAVASAALLHDIGHVAPGSHLAEHIWDKSKSATHEQISVRVVKEDEEINNLISSKKTDLPQQVTQVLSNDDSIPSWTKSIISGGGWNADRGNWAIVDSAMCSVSYGRYNVMALIEAFRLDNNENLVLLESRLDALTHFFVARDSMYRQVYQHRVLQSVDALTSNIIKRIRDLLTENSVTQSDIQAYFKESNIFADETMERALLVNNYALELTLNELFSMSESWWRYHVDHWTNANDNILSDLSTRLRDRNLLKTVRINSNTPKRAEELTKEAKQIAEELGYDSRYYVTLIDSLDKHRHKSEEPPLILLDSGSVVPVTEVEPIIAEILSHSENVREWLALPKSVKEKLGLVR